MPFEQSGVADGPYHFPEAVPLVKKALERPDQRRQLDAYLAAQASLEKKRSRRRPPG
jgi:hypothetical protein